MQSYVRPLFLSCKYDNSLKKFKVRAFMKSGQSFEFSSWTLKALSQAVDAPPAINDDVAVPRATTMSDDTPGDL